MKQKTKSNANVVGLTDAQVIQNREKYGANVLTPPKRESLILKFLKKFSDPLIIILLVAGILSVGISVYEYAALGAAATAFLEPAGIFVAILLSTGLSFIFEMRADHEFSILNTVNDDAPVTVIRNGAPTQVPRRAVVWGDAVMLNTGNEIPADGELISAVAMQVDESSLTGENVTEKTTNPDEFDPNATFPSNRVYRGTRVMSGHGVMRVMAVGDATENGRVFVAAQIDNTVKTPLNEQLDGLADVITKISYAFAGLIVVGRVVQFLNWNPMAWLLAVPVVMLFYIMTQRRVKLTPTMRVAAIGVLGALFVGMTFGIYAQVAPAGATVAALMSYLLQTLMLAVTLIVVAVPEGLPMAVTLSLAYSMRRMLQTKNLVRTMHACETMGATTVICTDKTGTLTQNQMRVHDAQFYCGGLNDILINVIAVNSTAELDTRGDTPMVLGNPTEGALLLYLRDGGVDYRDVRSGATVVQALPFATERKYAAAVIQMPGSKKRMLVMTGAPEIVLGMCGSVCGKTSRSTVNKQLLQYQSMAMRTLGFAYRELKPHENPIDGGAVVVRDLEFLGIVAISDPVRADVPASIAKCRAAGIDVKIVTGDTVATAMEIGRQIGLWTNRDWDKNIITGVEVAALTDAQLSRRAPSLKIIARARPMDKQRLVMALQSRGAVVAVTGDGTNDAPALRTAHVGLSMGDGTSVAKEASDITILDNSFASIVRAVMWGRSLYQNIQRFVLFQMTVNVSACLTVLAGAFMGQQPPITVTQMLWVNLIMDTFAAMALASLPPSESVMKNPPRDRNAFIITRAMRWNIGVVGALFWAVLIGLVYLFQHADVTGIATLLAPKLGVAGTITQYEGTMFFTIFVMLQFWNLFNARAFLTWRSAFHLMGCGGFWAIASLILVGQVGIVYFGGTLFSTVPLRTGDFVGIVVITSVVLWIGELIRIVGRLGKNTQ